ncbi:MAG TPA: hypothetical protein VJY34_17560 [Roseiarcus sp.]|nr:hypothetical protein [Roseiarcus sp.]
MAAPSIAKRRRNGQGATTRQPRNTEAEGGEIGSRRASLALRLEGSICGDDHDEAEALRPTSDDEAEQGDGADIFQSVLLVGGRSPIAAGNLPRRCRDIPGLSFLAFRRIATMLHVPALSAPGGPSEMLLVNPGELAAVIEADQSAT